MKTLFITSLLSALFLSSSAQIEIHPPDVQKLKWLEGSWKGMTATPFYEAWRVINDSTLVNLAIEIKNGDTLIRENSALLLRQNKLWLGRLWQTTRLTNNELVLKNDTLKYSNTIIWVHTPNDHWLAILENEKPNSTVIYDLVRDEALDKKVEAWINEQKRKR